MASGQKKVVFRQRAEVLGRYSNRSDLGKRFANLADLVPPGPPRSNLETKRQLQHRLSQPEYQQLADAYVAGETVVFWPPGSISIVRQLWRFSNDNGSRLDTGASALETSLGQQVFTQRAHLSPN